MAAMLWFELPASLSSAPIVGQSCHWPEASTLPLHSARRAGDIPASPTPLPFCPSRFENAPLLWSPLPRRPRYNGGQRGVRLPPSSVAARARQRRLRPRLTLFPPWSRTGALGRRRRSERFSLRSFLRRFDASRSLLHSGALCLAASAEAVPTPGPKLPPSALVPPMLPHGCRSGTAEAAALPRRCCCRFVVSGEASAALCSETLLLGGCAGSRTAAARQGAALLRAGGPGAAPRPAQLCCPLCRSSPRILELPALVAAVKSELHLTPGKNKLIQAKRLCLSFLGQETDHHPFHLHPWQESEGRRKELLVFQGSGRK